MKLITDITLYLIIPIAGLLTALTLSAEVYLEHKLHKKLKCPVEHDTMNEVLIEH